jgi:transposase-like protein
MQRKRYNAEFKARVALESLREDRTLAELSSAYGVHAAMINRWRKQLLERAHMAFCENAAKGKEEKEGLISSLYQQIGQLKVELDWVKKKSNLLK